jgi:hypothetical protein
MRRILVLAGMILLSVFVLAACHAHAAELRDLRDLNELRVMWTMTRPSCGWYSCSLLLDPSVLPAPVGCGQRFSRSIRRKRSKSTRSGFATSPPISGSPGLCAR